MNAFVLLLIIVLAYFLVLFGIAFYTSRNSNNESFFIGNRKSKWWVVAFGMIGTSLSGITFISVPGTVGFAGFDYFQLVIGFCIGYFIVAFVLLPIYYKLHVTSIYTYLEGRLGISAYKTGAMFFILSRTMGATIRLYLVINVLGKFILNELHVSFELTAIIILFLIVLYTLRGGVKTIVWTDTLQTTFMIAALIICSVYIMSLLNLNTLKVWGALQEHGYTKLFYTDPLQSNFFLKQIIGGAFITISMTGLDQEMMQKNISVSSLKGAQKNMISLSFLQAGAVFIFLTLGGLLYIYAISKGGSFQNIVINGKIVNQFILDGTNLSGDALFPTIALHYLPSYISIIFIIGLISALFPSADGALTALTSSFCIDILGILRKTKKTEKQKKYIRLTVHFTFAIVFLGCIFLWKALDNGSLVQTLLTVAGYTYGPLLALFSFGILTKRMLKDELIPIICIVAPILCYLLKEHEAVWLHGYHIGYELLIINAILTFSLLLLASKRVAKTQ